MKARAKKYDFHGESLSISEAAEKYNIKLSVLRARINNNKLPCHIAILSSKEIKNYKKALNINKTKK